ncbi:PREDICTED: uncharacterized protein LOC105560283 isoform X1 [Vollenhovia emeryi]|uniref:uncharacterized protein LOC105560283 isoform X1 n=1 Tax=Vollenhovia emeryi TaxID=411798 RepID=UPI0005F3EF6B|nr:PREDICTED: uncharacterized protein LOC105560283 isoform X1 [Vollenhovia emeryi]
MDSSLESTPTKRRCTLANESKIRPAAYAWDSQSQLSDAMSVVKPAALSLARPFGVQVPSNAENRVLYNLQKLRLLSPRGRDLGEFNVKLKTTDPSKGNTITITKSNVKPVAKPLALPLAPISHIKVLPRILKQKSMLSKGVLMEEVSCNGRPSWTDNGSRQRQREILPMSRVFSIDRDTEGKAGKQTCNNSSNINTAITSPTDGINSKRRVYRSVGSSNPRYVVHRGTGVTAVRRGIKLQDTAAAVESKKVPSATKVLLPKRVFKIPSSCVRLVANPGDESNIVSLSGKNLKVSRGKCIATIRNTENGRVVTSLKSAGSLVPGYTQFDKNLNRSGLRDNGRVSFNGQVLHHKDNSLKAKSDVVSKSQVLEVKTRNVMTIIPNDKTLPFNQNAVLAQENDAPVASASIKSTASVIDRNAKYDMVQRKHAKAATQKVRVILDDDAKRITKPRQSTDTVVNGPKKGLSDQLDIIRKAMDSVTDSKLRQLALTALTDCGVGLERYVPIRPPENCKTVHDTQVQTVVFGLLDPKSFVMINKNLEDIHRLNSITLYDTPGAQNLSLGNNSQSSNNSVSQDSNKVVGYENSFDLDSFIEQFWKEDSDALKMQETLSKTTLRCSALLEHLQRDFENVKRYDRDGMLSIHNAVVNDNVCLVRKQLMILERCEESVDMLTEDGETSLELAIKYNVSNEIVKLLLNAGAQPVLRRALHESAVIIASKKSSPLLPMLISRVTDSRLLDEIDSDGYAAIHYCSINGNLQGVKALLSAGVTVDLKDMKSGRTSLFHAIDNGHMSLIQVLLKAGAVASVVNYAGQTPLSIVADMKSIAFKVSLRKDT